MTTTVVDDLRNLHADYVNAVNRAVEAGPRSLVDELAASYERDVADLLAERGLA